MLIFVAVALVAALAGNVGSRFVRSPGDVLADVRAPEPTRLTATVQKGRLRSNVTAAGKVQWRNTLTLAPVQGREGFRPIITALKREPGDVINPGVALMEVADRPVILLAARVPLLRPLTIGDRGPDVARLQESLSNAGYYTAPDGVFGASTASALRDLYESNGYDPPVETSRSFPGKRKAPATSIAASPDELVFLPSMPVYLASVGGSVGVEVQEPMAVLASGRPGLKVDLPQSAVADLDLPKTRILVSVAHRKAAAGFVSSRGEAKTTEAGIVVPVTVTSEAFDASSVGRNARLTVVSRTAQAGLIVPSSAIYVGTDGVTNVRKVERGSETLVPVRVLGSSEGRALIRASPADLEVGDEVVTGAGAT